MLHLSEKYIRELIAFWMLANAKRNENFLISSALLKAVLVCNQRCYNDFFFCADKMQSMDSVSRLTSDRF